MYADRIFWNGKILTMDPALPEAEAVAVKDGTILAVGTDAEVKALTGDTTEQIDLHGTRMLPGIIDIHQHITQGGRVLRNGGNRGEVIMRESPYSDEEIRDSLDTIFHYLLERGVTSVTDGDMGPRFNIERGGIAGCRALSILNEMRNKHKLPIRIGVMLSIGANHGDAEKAWFVQELPKLGWHSGFGDEWLRINGLKLIADGVTGMGTALNTNPNPDGSNGRLLYAGDTDQARRDEMVEMVRLAHRYGFQVGIHCCGDQAIDAVADAFITAQEDFPADTRDYFIHGDLITPECIKRISKYRFGYSAFLPGMWEKGAALKRAIGTTHNDKFYPVRSLMDAGVVCTAHTDFPFTLTDWRLAVQCLVTRQAVEGTEVWGRDQAVSVEEALHMFTLNAAWQSHEEDIKGSIEPGKLADFTVLGEDILTVEPHRISEVPVVMTVVGGDVKFSK